MRGLQSMFRKKKKEDTPEVIQSEDFVTTDANSIKNLPKNELIDIIYRYDDELKNIYKSVEENKELTSENGKIKEELELYKEQATNLQLHVNQIKTELNDNAAVLDSRSAEIDILKQQVVHKDELINQYSASFKGSESNSTRSASEVDTEVVLLNKTLQVDNDKLVLRLKELKSDNKHLKTNIEALTSEKAEQEMSNYKSQIQCEALQRDLTNLQFQKDSAERESAQLRQTLTEKDQKHIRKLLKFDTFKSQLREATSKNEKNQAELEMIQSRHSLELMNVKADVEKEMRYKTELNNERMTSLGKDLVEKTKQWELLHQQHNDVRMELNSLSGGAETKDTEIQRLQSETNSLSIKNAGLQSENTRLTDSLQEAQRKREQAKDELIKISSQKSSLSSARDFPLISNIQPTRGELTALETLKKHFEMLYKHLMKLMMTSKTTKIQEGKMAYLLDTEEFSGFERRLNNVVMSVHEAWDNPELLATHEPTTPTTWKARVGTAIGAFKANGPVKIFSCMSSEDQGDDSKARPPRPEAPVIQRRGSVDNRSRGRWGG